MKQGIDVSRWQKGLSLYTAKQEGFTEIIIKCGGGDKVLYKDSLFDTFYNQARAAGLNIVGVYFFGYAFSEAEAIREANYAMSLLQGKDIKYIFYDVEGKMLNQGYTHLTNIIKAFCQTVTVAGYQAGVYSSESQFNSRFRDFDLKQYVHWVARYSKTAPKLNSGAAIDIWQYGGEVNYMRSNSIAGIVTDQNYVYSELKAPIIVVTPSDIMNKTTEELAQEVLAGKYGNGNDRKYNLGSRYNEVQALVDKIIREQTSKPVEKSVDQLAVEVLAGVWGNNPGRAVKLTVKYGLSKAKEVQRRVDEIVKSRKEENKVYVVQKNDTLSKIAKKYKTTWQKLAEVNNLKDPNKIYPGQHIIIA
jgi:LysM repeat protein